MDLFCDLICIFNGLSFLKYVLWVIATPCSGQGAEVYIELIVINTTFRKILNKSTISVFTILIAICIKLIFLKIVYLFVDIIPEWWLNNIPAKIFSVAVCLKESF